MDRIAIVAALATLGASPAALATQRLLAVLPLDVRLTQGKLDAAGRNPKRAVKLFEQACGGEGQRGCFQLGVALDKGTGTRKDVRRAVALFAQACDARVALACDALAPHYAHGIGVKKDRARAAALFRQACDEGLKPDCDHAKRVARGGR